MSNNKNSKNEDEGSSRVIDSFIRRAVDEGELDPDEFEHGSKNVFWDRTTIRAALGGLAVLIVVNLLFYYNMRLEQVDNTSDWQPERRGFLVEYREGRGTPPAGNSSEASSPRPERPLTQSQQNAPGAAQANLAESPNENPQERSVETTTQTEQEQPVEPDLSQRGSSTQEAAEVEMSVADNLEFSSPASEIPGNPALSPREQVRARVGSWAQAWTFQNVGRYLEHYSQDFISQGGAPFEPWAELRYERIESPEWIHVSVDQLNVSVNEESAVAEFIQVYTSSEFSSESRKNLVFRQEGDTWRIIRETVQPQ